MRTIATFTWIVWSAIGPPPLRAPMVLGIDEAPYLRHKLIAAIARTENCDMNPGCVRAKDGSYPRYSSLEAGMRALEHEVDRRRGHNMRWVLDDYNRGGTQDYADFVLYIADLSGEEILR